MYLGSDLERLFTYVRHLALKLPKDKSGPGYQFDGEVELDHHRVQFLQNRGRHAGTAPRDFVDERIGAIRATRPRRPLLRRTAVVR